MTSAGGRHGLALPRHFAIGIYAGFPTLSLTEMLRTLTILFFV